MPIPLRVGLTATTMLAPVHGIGVVVEGTLGSDGTFETQRLMVKHDNEYRAPDAEDDRSVEELMETMQFGASDG